MKANIILVSLMMLILLTGCNLISAPHKEKSGLSQFFITDSTGTERYTFHVNEPIFVHYKIINNTNHDIPYKKDQGQDDNMLFFYSINEPGSEVHIAGYLPLLQDTFLPKHESREQAYKIEGLSPDEYSIQLICRIYFKHPDDFKGNYSTNLLIKVVE